MPREDRMGLVGAITLVTLFSSRLGAAESGPPGPNPLWQEASEAPEAQIWLDRGSNPIVMPGDRVRVYYRSNIDAYVAILQIDADGTVRLLYPASPTENHYARSERDYRLLFPRSEYWNVDDRPGVGYFFVVTSPAPFDFSDFRYSHNGGGWDLSAVGSTVNTDPYVAIDEYVARLVPGWEYEDYGLDFVSYQVGGAHDYPRFLCYQCHGFRPYGTWNPYRYTCTDFRVVVYDDPYFYPSRRYRGRRVVYTVPPSPRPRFSFKERASGEPGTVVVTPVPANRRRSRTSTRDLPPSSSRARVRPPRASGVDVEARKGVPSARVAPPVRAPEASRPTLRRRSSAPRPEASSRGGAASGPSSRARARVAPPTVRPAPARVDPPPTPAGRGQGSVRSSTPRPRRPGAAVTRRSSSGSSPRAQPQRRGRARRPPGGRSR